MQFEKKSFERIVSGVDISSIEIDKSSEGYRQLMRVTKDVESAITSAEVQAKVKDIAAKQRIEAEHYEDSLRIQREESQYAQHMGTRTANMAAYQMEKQAELGVAGAEALGQMGANNAGDINISDGVTGFNPATMMASMDVGGVVGQNIAGMMGNAMNGFDQTMNSNATPLPVPVSVYHVVINGQAAGPFEINVLQQMVGNGQLTQDSLVWKSGMEQWIKANLVDELKHLFEMPPISPI